MRISIAHTWNHEVKPMFKSQREQPSRIILQFAAYIKWFELSWYLEGAIGEAIIL